MKNRKVYLIVLLLVSMLTVMVSGCSSSDGRVEENTGKIYLYGEAHGIKTLKEKEFDLWYDYYHNQGMRHLFIENDYCSAEFLNLWLQANDDEILNQLFKEWNGSLAGSDYAKEFYKKIKKECPETIFHGTDIGHCYDTIGQKFLEYLEENGKKDTEQYQLAKENIEQGKYYYAQEDDVYRENKMAENFVREFESLKNESIVGIYGSAHVDPESLNYSGTVDSMAKQLKAKYKDKIVSEKLQVFAFREPKGVETVEINGKKYKASYFPIEEAKEIMTGITWLEFWRIENAYDDFKDKEINGEDWMLTNSYPAKIEGKEIWIMKGEGEDGIIEERYYRYDGEGDKTYNIYID